MQKHHQSAGTSKKNFPSRGVQFNIPVYIYVTVCKIEGNSQRRYTLSNKVPNNHKVPNYKIPNHKLPNFKVPTATKLLFLLKLKIKKV